MAEYDETTYGSPFYFLKILVIRVLREFFGEYPECENLGFKWKGNPSGSTYEDSQVFIWDAFPEETVQFPAVVVDIDAQMSPAGLGSSVQTVGDLVDLGDGRSAFGGYKGYFFQGAVKYSVVGLKKSDHHILAGLLMNHHNHVLWKYYNSVNISCAQNVKNVRFVDNMFLRGQRIYMTSFDLDFLTIMKEFIPRYYNNYLIHLDVDGDGIDEKFYVENHEIDTYRLASVAQFIDDDWYSVDIDTAKKIVDELIAQKAEGTEQLITMGYIAQERVLRNPFEDTDTHIIEEELVPAHSLVDTTHIDNPDLIPDES